MGTSDFYVRVCVSVLNRRWGARDDEPAVVTQFKTISLEGKDADQISWTGTGLSIDQGWNDVAGGSLFIHGTFDPLEWTEECRDDVERTREDTFSYNNGYVLSRSETRCVYHVVFPALHLVTAGDYSGSGPIDLVHARVLAAGNRQALTWVFSDKIHLRIGFKKHPDYGNRYVGATKWPKRDELYEIAVKGLPRPDGVLAETKKQALADGIKMAVDQVPNIISLFGRLF